MSIIISSAVQYFSGCVEQLVVCVCLFVCQLATSMTKFIYKLATYLSIPFLVSVWVSIGLVWLGLGSVGPPVSVRVSMGLGVRLGSVLGYVLPLDMNREYVC